MPSPASRRYTALRRLTLSASVLFVVVVPAWHLARLQAEGTLSGNVFSGWVALLGGAEVDPPVVGAPWSTGLFGLELLDPLAALSVLVAGRPSWALLIAAVPAALLVALLGRFFCGWLCPYVPLLAASKAARELLEQLGFEPSDVEFRRSTPLLVLATILFTTAVGGSVVAPLIYPPSVIGREVFKAVALGGYGLGVGLIVAAFLFDTLVSKAGFCRSICPGGALFSLVGSLSFLGVARDEETCVDCGICDHVCNLGQLPMTDMVGAGCERCGSCVAACPTDALSISLGTKPAILVEVERLRAEEEPFAPSRRAFVGAAGAAVIGTLVLRQGSSATRLRPPGAIDAFERACIRCFRCAEVCPVGAIRFDSIFDLGGIDTPWIEPASQPCVLCMACTQTCPTGALSPIADDLHTVAAEVRMGTPVLNRSRCIAWAGKGECNACWQACPLPDHAVKLVGTGRMGPEFDADECVGCGLCEHACPDRARAIAIEPLDGRAT